MDRTGSCFLDLACVSLKPDQRPKDLYQSLMSFIKDNLLTRGRGEIPETDEELSPSLENFVMVVFTWLLLLHSSLPRLVKHYGTELRSRTRASVKPEISQANESLLDELHASDEIMQTAPMNFGRRDPPMSLRRKSLPKPRKAKAFPFANRPAATTTCPTS